MSGRNGRGLGLVGLLGPRGECVGGWLGGWVGG